MRSVGDWFAEYGQSHQHRTNKRIHWICVPLIVLSLMGLLRSLPVPEAFEARVPRFDWGVAVAILALLYYVVLSRRLALGIAAAFVAMYVILEGLSRLPWPLWVTSLAIFIGAWIGQFVGHAIEGSRPTFFKDLQFLLIGPLWIVATVYRALRIAY